MSGSIADAGALEKGKNELPDRPACGMLAAGESAMVDPQRLRVELVVQVPTGQEFRRLLTEGQPVRIGRAPVDGWAIVGDRSISREHADVCWADGRLSVTCLPSAANSIQWRGKTVRAVTVGPLDTFEI